MPISKILVVDDSAADLKLMQNIVSDAGFFVITATSGSEALAKAKSEKPDLIFLDVVMNDMDGFKTCRALSKDETTKQIPVIFVTSKDQPADKIRAEQQGAKGFVTKPAELDVIVEQIKKVAA